jgi:thioesterase domain-containing protein
VCFSSVMPMGGPHEYSALARRLDGVRTLLALPQPGFVAGEELPASLEALVATQVEAVLGCGPAPAILCGHSSGGLVAHAVASRLEALGQPPAGLVLIDTYWPDPAFLAGVLPRLVRIAAGSHHPVSLTQAGPTRLTAMGGYLRILADWQPAPIVTPTLFLRAQEPLAALGPGAGTPLWKLPHTVTEIPGDHFSAIDAYAGSAVAAIESWLADSDGSGRRQLATPELDTAEGASC